MKATRRQRIPAYPKQAHKTGQAKIQWQGKSRYFGLFGTPESHEKFREFVHQLTAREPRPLPTGKVISVALLVSHYLDHAKAYYSASQYDHLRRVGGLLNLQYGKLSVAQFGPSALKEFRERLVNEPTKRGPRSRNYVNDQIKRVRRLFSWGVENELVPSFVMEGLRAVKALKAYRTTAPERPKVKPVPQAVIDAVLPHLTPTVATMLRVQRLTGMRPGSLCAMRPCDIDQSDSIWVYTPPKHKTTWREKELHVPLGPQVQLLLAPYLKLCKPEEYLFSPRRAVAEKNAQRRENRKTKVQPSQLYRQKEHPKRTPGKRYQTGSYRRAIYYGVIQARKTDPDLIRFYPHQVRHTRATELRKQRGIEGAKVALGHAHVSATLLYAQADMDLAKQIALESG